MCGHGTHRFPLLECLLASRQGRALPLGCQNWLSPRNTDHLGRTLKALLALLAREDDLALGQLARQICCCLHQGDCDRVAGESLFAAHDQVQAEWLIQAAALVVAEARWPERHRRPATIAATRMISH